VIGHETLAEILRRPDGRDNRNRIEVLEPPLSWGQVMDQETGTVVEDSEVSHWPLRGGGFVRRSKVLFPPSGADYDSKRIERDRLVGIRTHVLDERSSSVDHEMFGRFPNLAKSSSLSKVANEFTQESTSSSTDEKVMSARRNDSSVITKFLSDKLSDVPDLTSRVDRIQNNLIGRGSFGDVYRGRWKSYVGDWDGPHLPDIAVKVTRRFDSHDSQVTRHFAKSLRRELAVWQGLSHENIVPFLGIAMIDGVFPSIVTSWMPNGSVKEYLKKNPDASQETMVLGIIIGIIKGLAYLHSRQPTIVHGDLHAANVLIDSNGIPCLCDYGLSRIMEDTSLWQTGVTAGALRWKPPELLVAEELGETVQSDIYAFGMTCFEIYTGKVPFHAYKRDIQVLVGVALHHEVPDRPWEDKRVSDALWEIWMTCWDREPKSRPSAQEVIAKLI